LYADFCRAFPYISVGREVVKRFVDEWEAMSDRERELNLLRDYVLAGDYADEVVL
jgi:hypothetical protein